MKTLIILIFMLSGLVVQAEQSASASEDPNMRRNFDGASTFLDPTNPDCKPCQEYLRTRQNFSRDLSGNFSPQSLGRMTPNQPVKPGTIRNPPVKTGK